jgi:hypothetical protein
MTSTRLILGGLAGLLVAAVLIGGVSLYGGAAVHIDLLRGGAVVVAGHGPNSPGQAVAASLASNSTTSATVSAQVVEGTAVIDGVSSPVPSTISSVDTLMNEPGSSLILLLLPIAAGAILGLMFYRLYTDRVDAE